MAEESTSEHPAIEKYDATVSHLTQDDMFRSKRSRATLAKHRAEFIAALGSAVSGDGPVKPTIESLAEGLNLLLEGQAIILGVLESLVEYETVEPEAIAEAITAAVVDAVPAAVVEAQESSNGNGAA